MNDTENLPERNSGLGSFLCNCDCGGGGGGVGGAGCCRIFAFSSTIGTTCYCPAQL